MIWDQEIYDPFYYNQDRTFFHSFELEECLAGFSFVSEKEAKQFKKKMDEREKNASKETRATPFQGSGEQPLGGSQVNSKSHHRFGLGSLLHGGQRSSSAPHVQPVQPVQQPQSSIPPPALTNLNRPSPTRDRASSLDTVDPSWRGILGELLEMGITEDQIEQNSDFIKDYIEQRKASGDPIPGTEDGLSAGPRRSKAPPPPPPSAPLPGKLEPISPQDTGSTITSRRGPAPAPPPQRRSRTDNQPPSSGSQRPPSPPISPEKTPSPPRQSFQFRAPPPLADAGKFAGAAAIVPKLPTRPRASSNVANPGPPPPPRPPKTPMEEEVESRPKFGVPPPFQGDRTPAAPPPPPPPPRAPATPASPRTTRETSGHGHAVPPAAVPPPPLPPKQPSIAPSSGPPPPPPLPGGRNSSNAPPAPPLPSVPRPIPSTPTPHTAPPPPPPMPPQSGGAPPPPPPPPMPSSGGPPPPPLPPGRDSTPVPPLPQPTGGKEDLLASIRGSGGIGGGRLKRVSSQEKRDRSAAAVPGGAPAAASPGGAPPPPSGGGSLGDALAAALSQRNKKVSASGKPFPFFWCNSLCCLTWAVC